MNRQPSGTPAGGRFAPSGSAEAEVTLADPSSADGPPEESDGDRYWKLTAQINTMTKDRAVVARRMLATDVRSAYPAATHVTFGTNHVEGTNHYPVSIDAAGEVLAELETMTPVARDAMYEMATDLYDDSYDRRWRVPLDPPDTVSP